MNQKTTAKILACLLPIFYTGASSAALFDLNATNFGVTGGVVYDSVGMASGGISVDIGALSIDNDDAGNISGTNSLSVGLGVYVSSSTSGNVGVKSNLTTDGSNMDGGSVGDTDDLDEGLLFTFDQTVRLDLINFDSFTSSSSDDFNLTVDGVLVLLDYNANDTSALVNNDLVQFDQYTFNNITGTKYLFWADSNTDSFRIDRLEVTAVPVPAAAWLFGSGLLGLVGVARRKQNQ